MRASQIAGIFMRFMLAYKRMSATAKQSILSYISKTKDMLMAKEFIKISPFLLKNRGEFKFIKEQR